jgi:exodeoxyribonuclease (lambda-induced)
VRFIECAQGTPEWHAARAGLCTASCFADAVSVLTRASGKRELGDPTAAAERYASDLAIEIISGKPHGEPPKAWVLERGHEMEAQARMIYEARTGAFVTEAGICVDGEGFGYSTDGLVEDDGLIEIKAPIDSLKIMAMWANGDVSEYLHQMQGGMWITGRQWCDFIMYVPDLHSVGKDLFVKRIHRDDEFIDKMVPQLARFWQMVQQNVAVLRGANWPVYYEPAPLKASA